VAVFEKEDTLHKVVEIVADKLNVDKETVAKSSSFEELGADSLDMVEIVMKLEEQFGLEINDEDAEKLCGVNEVVEYIQPIRKK